jgi:phenylacetic acid degradation operon negative regulatory protein
VSTRRNTTPAAHDAGPATLLERPLTARSVVLSLLLGRHPPAAPVAMLVRWCAVFGISGTAARVALSRMVERGELSAHDAVYELTGRLRRRQAAQEFALTPATTHWDGGWVLAVVVATDRSAAQRAALRTAMAELRMAELREGVWCRPDNVPAVPASEEARDVSDAQCATWRGAVPDEPVSLVVERLFAPTEWARRGAILHDRLVAATHQLDDGALAEPFVVGAAVAQHLRRDPLLPDALLAPGWPGAPLRSAYSSYVGRFGAAVAAWAGGPHPRT